MVYTRWLTPTGSSTATYADRSLFEHFDEGIYDAHQLGGSISVNTVAALRAVTNLSGLVQTLGQTALDDGITRLYYWNASSTASDDGATVVKPTAVSSGSPGRWLEVGILLSSPPSNYTITNHTTSRTINADAYTMDQLADLVGTLITDLKNAGWIR